jgi:pimeloyl-ACP methyl ester carboxylesterase
VVLVNGWAASSRAWPSGWLRELRARYRVTAVDNRGSGWSRFADTPFTIADLAGDVVAVMDAAEVEHATVVGVSMGGMIAQEAALRAPERVTGLVLAATRAPAPEFTQRPALRVAAAFLRPPLGESLDRYFARQWSLAAAPGFADRHPELIAELTRRSVERPTPRAMLVHQLRAMAGWSRAGRLARVAVPTVVVHGAEDRLAPVRNGRRLAELIPGARYLELPGVGHLVAHEAPEQLTEAIASVTRSAAT